MDSGLPITKYITLPNINNKQKLSQPASSVQKKTKY